MIGRWGCRGKAAVPAVIVALAAAAPSVVRAQADTGTFIARDFRPASGPTVSDLRLPYRTLGRLRAAPGGRARNAVLVLASKLKPAQAGALGDLFGPGEPLDTTLTFVILPGAPVPGRGVPRLDDEDLTALQYRLVTEGLRVDHLVLVTGSAAGCAQSRLWAARWPGMMDAALPFACPERQPGGPFPVSAEQWRAEVADLLARVRWERIE